MKTVRETKDGIVQVCTNCQFRGIYNKDIKGRVDNERYLKDHVRVFAQPGGRTGHIYRMIQGSKKLDTYKTRGQVKKETDEGWNELEKVSKANNKTYL